MDVATNQQIQEFHGVCDENQSHEPKQVEPEVEPEAGGLDFEDTKDLPPISLWTRKTIGIPVTGFFCGYMVGILVQTKYGFYLGYLGLEPYVIAAVHSFSKMPEVLLLPFGVLSDSVPIMGMHRKPYLMIAWLLVGLSACMVVMRPLPDPYYCIGADGTYDYDAPPCNPGAHGAKTWYVMSSVLACTGLTMAQVAGEGLIMTYSQREPFHCRGKVKSELVMSLTAGQLTASLTVAILMNSKEYLGTFDWGLGYDGIHVLALILCVALLLITCFFIEEPKRRQLPEELKLRRSDTVKLNLKDSWKMVKHGAFMGILMFGFASSMMVHVQTTAAPMVRSRWAGVKVLPQQLCQMAAHVAEIFAVWMVKRYFLQFSWRKLFFGACLLSICLDAVPAFLTVFNVVRNQYFYLGEEVLAAIPTAAVKLVTGFVLIELAEEGKEGLCIGLMGTVLSASAPFGTAVGNQIFALFRPSLSDAKNYEADTFAFQKTVAMSYFVTYATTLSGFLLVRLIPDQKEAARRQKQTWSSSICYGVLVLALPGLSCLYSLVLLLLTNLEATSCLEFLGGQGC